MRDTDEQRRDDSVARAAATAEIERLLEAFEQIVPLLTQAYKAWPMISAYPWLRQLIDGLPMYQSLEQAKHVRDYLRKVKDSSTYIGNLAVFGPEKVKCP